MSKFCKWHTALLLSNCHIIDWYTKVYSSQSNATRIIDSKINNIINGYNDINLYMLSSRENPLHNIRLSTEEYVQKKSEAK